MILRNSMITMLTGLLALTACAGGPEEASLTYWEKLSNKGYAIGEQVRRVQNYRLNGWSYIDDRHVIFDSGVSDHYLVSLKQDCRDLRSAINIGFSTTIGNLTDKDKLIVRAPGDFTQICLIDTLHELEKIKRTASVE